MAEPTISNTEERRVSTQALVNRLGDVENDLGGIKTELALITDKLKGQDSLKKLVWGTMLLMVTNLISFGYGYGRMQETIANLDNTTLEKEMVAMEVAQSNYNKEIQRIRDDDQLVRATIEELRRQLSTQIDSGTKDRYYGTDARQDWSNNKLWIESKFDNIKTQCTTQRDWVKAKLDHVSSRMGAIENYSGIYREHSVPRNLP